MPSNIAALKKLSTRLLETESELSAFWNLAPNLFIISKRSGEIVKVNDSWKRLLGYLSSELVGHFSREFIHPEDMWKTKKIRERAFRLLKVVNFRHRWRHKDGHYLILNWNSTLCYSDKYIYGIAEVKDE